MTNENITQKNAGSIFDQNPDAGEPSVTNGGIVGNIKIGSSTDTAKLIENILKKGKKDPWSNEPALGEQDIARF